MLSAAADGAGYRYPSPVRATLTVDGTAVIANTSDRFVSFTFDWHICEIEVRSVGLWRGGGGVACC